MKPIIFLGLAIIASPSLAGESGLTKVYQPFDNFNGDGILIESVMCYEHNVMSGLPTAISLITAKNIPPTNWSKPIEDVNLASVCNLNLGYEEDAVQKITVTMYCGDLTIPQRVAGRPEEIVGATLECLRLVMGKKLDQMSLKIQTKEHGQEKLRELFEKFVRHPKDKPFPWKITNP